MKPNATGQPTACGPVSLVGGPVPRAGRAHVLVLCGPGLSFVRAGSRVHVRAGSLVNIFSCDSISRSVSHVS